MTNTDFFQIFLTGKKHKRYVMRCLKGYNTSFKIISKKEVSEHDSGLRF